MNEAGAASRANRAALSALLNRANIMSALFCTIVQELGDRSCSQAFVLKTSGEDVQKALEDGALLDELVHFSSLCELHEKHFPVDEVYFPLLLGKPTPAAAPAPQARAPAPTRTGAAAAGVAPPKPTRGKSKSPARARPGSVVTTGASAAAGSSSAARPPAPPRPSASPAATPAAPAAPVAPAAAAGMTAMPLVPTLSVGGRREAAAPRRRAREAARARAARR